MNKVARIEITKKIIELKLQPQTVKTKREIQKLQQQMDTNGSSK